MLIPLSVHTGGSPSVGDQQLDRGKACRDPRELYEECKKAYAEGLPASGGHETVDAVGPSKSCYPVVEVVFNILLSPLPVCATMLLEPALTPGCYVHDWFGIVSQKQATSCGTGKIRSGVMTESQILVRTFCATTQLQLSCSRYSLAAPALVSQRKASHWMRWEQTDVQAVFKSRAVVEG